MPLPNSPSRSKALITSLGVLILLAGATGCSSSEKLNIGNMLGIRVSVRDTGPLVADRAELTAYDPHNHTPAARLVQTSATRQSRR